jgi:hypothetical protein
VLFQFFNLLFDRGWEAAIFGGVIRDLVVSEGRCELRDIDIVVKNTSSAELQELCAPWIQRTTRFGGLHLRIAKWPVDIWRIEDTWALKNATEPVSFDQLPRTTFLTTESVAVSLRASAGTERRIYAGGFFESILSRVIAINHQDNPYPELCVVRSLVTAHRLKMAIAPDLCEYLVRTGHGMSNDDLEAIQADHYGRVRYMGATLASCISAISDHLERFVSAPKPYAPVKTKQLLLALHTDQVQPGSPKASWTSITRSSVF